MANNNEKILNLLSNQSEIKALSKVYLEQLRVRSEQKSEIKSNYFTVRRSLNSLNQKIDRKIKSIEKYLAKRETLFVEIKAHASNMSSQFEDDGGKLNKVLEELLEASYDEFTIKNASGWSEYLRKESSSKYRRIIQLLSKVDDAKYNREDTLNLSKISSQIEKILENNMKSQKKYLNKNRDKELSSSLQNIKFPSLTDGGYLQELQTELTRISNSILIEEITPYPDTTELEELFHGIREPNLYIKRGYTILEYVKKIYSSMNRIQRNFREQREYKGAKNGFDKYFSAINDLQKYYNTKYVQAGGKPKNYHGHRAGERN